MAQANRVPEPGPDYSVRPVPAQKHAGRPARLKIEPLCRAAALKRGRRQLAKNITASTLACTALAVIAPHYSAVWFTASATAGFVWANWFEYAYHRWFQHNDGPMAKFHDEHHIHWRTEDEPAHVPFDSAWLLVLVILVNTAPFLAADYFLGWAITPGLCFGFAVYSALSQELHWMIHVEKVPGFLRWCQKHHLRHHARGDRAYNVFLPIFDLLAGTM